MIYAQIEMRRSLQIEGNHAHMFLDGTLGWILRRSFGFAPKRTR